MGRSKELVMILYQDTAAAWYLFAQSRAEEMMGKVSGAILGRGELITRLLIPVQPLSPGHDFLLLSSVCSESIEKDKLSLYCLASFHI